MGRLGVVMVSVLASGGKGRRFDPMLGQITQCLGARSNFGRTE